DTDDEDHHRHGETPGVWHQVFIDECFDLFHVPTSFPESPKLCRILSGIPIRGPPSGWCFYTIFMVRRHRAMPANTINPVEPARFPRCFCPRLWRPRPDTSPR